MQLGVLITNHGKHSNEKLAIACAGDIIQIGADAAGQQAIDGRKLENKIIEILEASFAKLAEFEHTGIDAKGTEHLSSEYVAHPEIYDAAVTDIMAAIAASPLASWFNNDDTKGNVTKAVEKWLLSGHHMHRDWFARWGKVGHGTELKDHEKHDPSCEHVKNWIAAA
jgi:hypothetical protein